MYKSSVRPEDIENLQLGYFKGRIDVIDAPGHLMDSAISYLAGQEILGFDTETRPVFNSHQHNHGVALLQLSGEDRACLFRVQKVGIPPKLAEVLGSPDILKIGAASHDDVRALQRIAQFREQSYVDLQKIAWQWGIADKSVKKLAAIIMGFKISKTQQTSNWEAEKLTEAQIRYAATDAWVCRQMYCKLLQSEKSPLAL